MEAVRREEFSNITHPLSRSFKESDSIPITEKSEFNEKNINGENNNLEL